MIGYGKWSLVPGIGMLLVGAAHAGDMMDEFAWSARPVIVFAGSETDPMATEQLARLEAERSALIERDMVVISLFPDRSEVEGKMSVLSSKEIRARYDVPLREMLEGN